jgi:hypothetical protein
VTDALAARLVDHPTHASWMNLVDVWFSIIERQAIHRGTFGSVKDLNAQDPRLHHRLEQQPITALRLDQNRRSDPQESRPSADFRRRALALEVRFEVFWRATPEAYHTERKTSSCPAPGVARARDVVAAGVGHMHSDRQAPRSDQGSGIPNRAHLRPHPKARVH